MTWSGNCDDSNGRTERATGRHCRAALPVGAGSHPDPVSHRAGCEDMAIGHHRNAPRPGIVDATRRLDLPAVEQLSGLEVVDIEDIPFALDSIHHVDFAVDDRRATVAGLDLLGPESGGAVVRP